MDIWLKNLKSKPLWTIEKQKVTKKKKKNFKNFHNKSIFKLVFTIVLLKTPPFGIWILFNTNIKCLMKKLATNYFFIAVVCLVCTNCTKSDESFSNTELTVYFDLFEQEAAIRGFEIDLKAMGITGHFVNISEKHVAGRCKYSDRNPAMVMVDKHFWSTSNEFQKEHVIFHELGHCILSRDHRNEALESGECVSIMASDNRICAAVYMPETRKAYLDELFYYAE